jgi:O-methyltransferase
MLKESIKKAFNSVGLNVSRYYPEQAATPTAEFPLDFEKEYIDIIKSVKPYTMTSHERLYQLIYCVKYVIENNIPGDLVECGVWRGGSILTMIKTLQSLKVSDRKLQLFDTFSSDDIFETKSAVAEDTPFQGSLEEIKESSGMDFSVDLDDVKRVMRETGYPFENVVFNVGRVEETIPQSQIDRISLLRLDTDWYDSTKFQLEELYDKVVPNGVVIFDDYGFWKGHKKAADEFLEKRNIKPLMMRNDWSCRLFIKNI